MKHPVLYIFTCLAVLLSSSVCAQQWEFGATFGGTGYMGDINHSDPLYYTNMGGGLSVQYNFNPTWGVRVNSNYIRISGSDQDAKNEFQNNRNFSFSNDIWEMSAIGKFNFFRFVPNYDQYSFTPYLYAGAAAIRHSPYAFYQDEKLHLMELMINQDSYDEYESPNHWAISIPYGFGLKYNLKGPWTIGAEIGYRSSLTNKLDNVSGNYAYRTDATTKITSPLTYQDAVGKNPNIQQHPVMDEALWNLLADPSGRLDSNYGRPRGSGGRYDGYMTAGLTITYSIISTRCYWW